MRAYSIGLRERVLADVDARLVNDATARKCRVSGRWVYKLRRQRDEASNIASRRGRTGPKPKLDLHAERLTGLIVEHPDAR